MRASTEHSTNTELPHYTAACLGPLQLILGLRKSPLLWIGLRFGLRFTLGLWLRAVQATNVLRRFLVGLDAQAQGVDIGNEPLVLDASCDGLLPAGSFIYQVCKSRPAVNILTYLNLESHLKPRVCNPTSRTTRPPVHSSSPRCRSCEAACLQQTPRGAGQTLVDLLCTIINSYMESRLKVAICSVSKLHIVGTQRMVQGTDLEDAFIR